MSYKNEISYLSERQLEMINQIRDLTKRLMKLAEQNHELKAKLKETEKRFNAMASRKSQGRS